MRLCGFAMAEFYPPAFQIRDMAVLPEEPGATLALFVDVATEARRRRIPLAGRMYLPPEPSIDAALHELFGSTLHAGEDNGHIMARAMATAFTDAHLHAIFSAPGAHFSAIDLF